MNFLLVDHRDSFTRNLEHLLAPFGETKVRDRLEPDLDEKAEQADLLVFSPGPGKPADYPETHALYQRWRGRKPILGICLGFQLMLEAEGARIIRQKQVLHGVETELETLPDTLTYAGIEPPIRVGRYHSLQVAPDSLAALPGSLAFTARDPIRDVPLSFEDRARALFGLQYHPESFLTPQGEAILSNLLKAPRPA